MVFFFTRFIVFFKTSTNSCVFQIKKFEGCWLMNRSKKFSLPLTKIFHTYPTMMKFGRAIFYLKKIQKTYESRETPLELCWHHWFFAENQQILIYQEIQIYIAFWYIISNSFNIFWVFKYYFNKNSYNFDNISKICYPKPKIFRNIGYDIIISVHDVSKKILSHDSKIIS